MPRAIFFIKIARSYLFTSASASLYSHPVLLSILPLLLSIPTSASLYPRPEPDLLLDTPDFPVAVLLPTTFPCRDTPLSP